MRIVAGDADAGPYFVVVSYTNAAGDDADTNFTWIVGNPVTLADPGTQTVTEGTAVSVSVADSPGGSLAYRATDLPPGLTLNTSTGLISGVIADGDATAGDDSAGTYVATVAAMNAYGSIAAVTVEWDVSPAVTVADLGDQSSTVRRRRLRIDGGRQQRLADL